MISVSHADRYPDGPCMVSSLAGAVASLRASGETFKRLANSDEISDSVCIKIADCEEYIPIRAKVEQ